MHTFQDPGVREREWDRILEHIRESQEKRISCIPRENFKNCKESEKNPRKASEASQKNLSNGKESGKNKVNWVDERRGNDFCRAVQRRRGQTRCGIGAEWAPPIQMICDAAGVQHGPCHDLAPGSDLSARSLDRERVVLSSSARSPRGKSVFYSTDPSRYSDKPPVLFSR